MANYVKFKQGLKKDFNTTNQPLTNGMIYFVIDENNHGSIYYDTVVDGKKATKSGAVHRVKFSGLPVQITGSVTGTGIISEDGESIVINTLTNHSHGLMHQDFTVTLSDDDTDLRWLRLGNYNQSGFWLKSVRGQSKAPAWFQPDYSAGIAFGGADTKGIISVRYQNPSVRFAGGNSGAPVWYFTITGANDKTYDLSKIGGHSSDSAKLDHNVTFKIASTADVIKGGNGTATDLSGTAVDLYLPTKISGFDLLQATRFQGNADTSTVAAKLGRGGNTSLPMTFYWDGSKGGQPTWLWGGENGTDMYVYNPSNFKVAHSVSTAGLDHDVTFKISKVADATVGETGVTTKLTENAITFTIPNNLSGFSNIQSTRFQGTADNADTVDYFHVAEEKYKYETTKTQPTSGAEWCIKISTADWNDTSETIYLIATGNNARGTIILKTGSRQSNWWGYATNYNGTGIAGVYKVISNSDDVYVKVGANYTSVVVRTTFNPKDVSIPSTIPSYKYTSVPSNGGFFSNSIYTDNLTFTTPKYWANIQISDSSNTETKPTFNTAYTSNWWRSTGNTGWWNETHLGGITMEDDTYVKIAGNKSFLIPNGSLKIGGNGNIFFATGYDDATLKIYGQTNTDFGTETIAIQTCFDNQDPQTSGYTTQYANRCNLLLQPRGGQVYIGKNLTAVGDTGYKLLVDGNQWTSGSQWVNGNLLFTDITGNTADTGMSLKGIYGRIGGNDGWRIAGGARESNAGYLEISTCDDMNEPIYIRQYGGGGAWNGYVSLARTFTLLDASGRSRAPELFEAKKVHVNSELNQDAAISDIGYQFQVTGTSNFTDNVSISGVTTHHNNIQMDANYSIAKPGKSSAWYGSHTNAMIRMTSVNGWSPLLAQRATGGYWVLGHYTEGDFKNQWLFGYLADSNLEGTTGASNSLSTTYRLLNIDGDSQRMFVSAAYNAAVGSGTQPVYVQSNGNVTACSYSLSATIEVGTANRIAYYKAANQIGSSGHYVTSSQVGINSNTTHDFTFYVGGNSYFSNLVTVYTGNNLGIKIGNTNITAIDGSLIFQNNTALRFGSSEWDWNKWAGLKYVPSSKTIVMGLADSTNFVANAVQSGGTFLFTGMTSIDLNKTASIKNLAVGGGIYWNPYVESAEDGSDAASITVIAGGVAGGTELRIQQQNDANDVINLVVNNSIFLNGKRAFRPFDGWLRINEDSSFGAGIYTGTSLIRSDNQLQVGDNGNDFYANNSGNGYFRNTLGIAGVNTNYKLYVNGISYFYLPDSTVTTENNPAIKVRGKLDIYDNITGGGTANSLLNILYNGTHEYGTVMKIHSYGGDSPSIRFSHSDKQEDLHKSPNTTWSVGMYYNTYNKFAITRNRGTNGWGTADLVIDSTGKVGIGIVSPDYLLHVKGQTQIAGMLIVTPTNESNWTEGIRINNANNGWTSLLLGGTATSGHSAATWSLHTYNNAFYLTHDGSSSSSTGILYSDANGNWCIKNTFGVNGQNTNYTCYINGTLFSGTHTVYGRSDSNTAPSNFYYNGALEIRESNLVTSSQSSFNYAPRIGFHWGGRIAASLSFNSDGIFYFRKQDGSSRATIDANVNGLATNASNSTNAEYVANESVYMRFHWSGQGGQPTWLWGGNEAGHMYVYNPSNFSVNYANSAGNADTVDGVHLEWGGSQAASATEWIAGWTSDGKKIKAVKRSDLETKNADTVDGYHAASFFIHDRLAATNTAGDDGLWGLTGSRSFHGALPEGLSNIYSYGQLISFSTDNSARLQIYAAHTGSTDSTLSYRTGWGTEKRTWRTFIDSGNIGSQSVNIAAKLGRSGNVAYPMTFNWSGQGGQPTWLWGGENGTDMYVYNPSNFSVSNAGYIRSMGNQAPESGRTATRGGVYTYNMYDQTANGAPGTYLSVIGFGNGTGGHIEIAGQWTGSSNLWMRGLRDCCDNWYSWNRIWCQGNSVTGAVWNDYAECRQSDCSESGRVVFEKGDDTLTKTEKRLQHFAGVISDTWGFSQGETDKAKTNIAVAGRVLVYTYQNRSNYKPGDCVCAAPDGTIDIMTREEIIRFPDRIVGTVSCVPDYEEWGGGKNADRDPVKVNGRIWIKVR